VGWDVSICIEEGPPGLMDSSIFFYFWTCIPVSWCKIIIPEASFASFSVSLENVARLYWLAYLISGEIPCILAKDMWAEMIQIISRPVTKYPTNKNSLVMNFLISGYK
jgi:hypothetical protein